MTAVARSNRKSVASGKRVGNPGGSLGRDRPAAWLAGELKIRDERGGGQLFWATQARSASKGERPRPCWRCGLVRDRPPAQNRAIAIRGRVGSGPRLGTQG